MKTIENMMYILHSIATVVTHINLKLINFKVRSLHIEIGCFMQIERCLDHTMVTNDVLHNK